MVWTMEWTKEQTFMLIELYQSHPVLWDPTDPTYKNKVKKIDAWVVTEASVDHFTISPLVSSMSMTLAETLSQYCQ